MVGLCRTPRLLYLTTSCPSPSLLAGICPGGFALCPVCTLMPVSSDWVPVLNWDRWDSATDLSLVSRSVLSFYSAQPSFGVCRRLVPGSPGDLQIHRCSSTLWKVIQYLYATYPYPAMSVKASLDDLQFLIQCKYCVKLLYCIVQGDVSRKERVYVFSSAVIIISLTTQYTSAIT